MPNATEPAASFRDAAGFLQLRSRSPGLLTLVLLRIPNLFLHSSSGPLDLSFVLEEFVPRHLACKVLDGSLDLLANAFVLIAIHGDLLVNIRIKERTIPLLGSRQRTLAFGCAVGIGYSSAFISICEKPVWRWM
jgi:hypothetical protein